jgi:hypothetical protein
VPPPIADMPVLAILVKVYCACAVWGSSAKVTRISVEKVDRKSVCRDAFDACDAFIVLVPVIAHTHYTCLLLRNNAMVVT